MAELTETELKDQAAELEAALATGIPEQLSFYEGTETVYYRDDLHAYYKLENGKPIMVVGVTSALDKIDKPALVQWAANTTVDHLREKAVYSQFKTGSGEVHTFITKENLEAMFNDARFNWREIANVAKDIGKLAHGWLQQFVGLLIEGKATIYGQLLSSDSTLPNVEDSKAINCVDAALRWMQKHKFEPISTEKKIYSREYSYSGTFDWLALITSCGDPLCCPFEGTVLALGDWKSSKRLYDEYRVQISAYVKAYEEEFPDSTIGVRVLIRLGKEDGEFESMVISKDSQEADFQGFLGALSIYNWDKQLKIDKKYKKSLAKIVADEAKALAKAVAKEEKELIKAQAKLDKEEAKELAKQEKAQSKLAAKAIKKPPKIEIKELPDAA